MRVSADPALSATLSSGDRNAAPAAEEEDAGFEHILQRVKTPQAREPSPVDAPPRRMNWSALAAALADKSRGLDDDAETAETEVDDPADRKTGENRPAREDAHQPPPMPNGGPWLLATYDPHRKPVPATAPDDVGKGKAQGRTGIVGHADAQASIDAPLPNAKTPPTATVSSATGQPPTEPFLDPAAANDIPPSMSGEPTPTPLRTQEATPRLPADKNSAPAADKQIAAPVTVIAAQSFPAPAPAPANRTITALAGAIATGSGSAPTLSASAGLTLPAQPVAAASHLMKIELHPAELGVVTANLRLAGGQLSIELKPENQEAHRRLSADSDALVKALQGLGFTIDKVTVLQPIVAATATPRMDAPTGSTGRDPSSFQPGNSGGNGDPAGGQQFGRNRGNEGQHGGNGGAPLRDRAGGGLFI